MVETRRIGGLEPLPILGTALAGVDRVVWSLPLLLAIFWLPWLLGTVALLILEMIVEDQLRLGPAPAWARNIVWGPFAAMAYLNLLRLALKNTSPAHSFNLDMGKETWIAAPIVAAWFVTNDLVSATPLFMLNSFVLPTDPRAYRWEDVAAYAYAFNAIAWLVKGALAPFFFGLMVVLVYCRRLDLHMLLHLLRLRPVRLFCISLLAAAAVGGASALGFAVIEWLGAGQIRPVGMIPWRTTIHWMFLAELSVFPIHFLDFAIQGCVLAEAYRQLLPRLQVEAQTIANV